MVTRGLSLVSLNCLLSHGGIASPFSGCCRRSWTAASVESSTALLVTRGKWSYCGVSSLVILLWQRSYHGETGSLFGVTANDAASTELSSLFCELFYFVFEMYVLFMCCVSVFFLCVHMPEGAYMND